MISTTAVIKTEPVSGAVAQSVTPKTVFVSVYGVGVRRSVINVYSGYGLAKLDTLGINLPSVRVPCTGFAIQMKTYKSEERNVENIHINFDKN